jgi:hypothetical protein
MTNLIYVYWSWAHGLVLSIHLFHFCSLKDSQINTPPTVLVSYIYISFIKLVFLYRVTNAAGCFLQGTYVGKLRRKDWILDKGICVSIYIGNVIIGANQISRKYKRPRLECSSKKNRKDYETGYNKITIEGEKLLLDYNQMGHLKLQILIQIS